MDSRYLLYLALLLTASVFGLIQFKRQGLQFRIFSCYFTLIFVSEVLTRVTSYYYQTSMPNYHVLVPLQMLFYAWFFSLLLLSGKSRRTVLLVGVLAAFLSLANSVFLQSIFEMPSNTILLLSLMIISLVLLSFRNLLLRPSEMKILQTPLFWFNVGSLVFYGFTFTFIGYYNVYGVNLEWAAQFIWIPNMFMYSCYFYALYLASKKGSFT